MTDLNKTVKRRSRAARWEKSQRRQLIVTLEATQKIGVRLEGTRQTYRLDIESVYELAVRYHLARIERRAKELQKEEGLKKRSSLARARRDLAADLK